MTSIAVVIPAGGRGTRMGGRAKPFLELCGRPLLQHTIQPFLARSDVVEIVIALPEALHEQRPDWLRDSRVRTVAGGAKRMDSVRLGLDLVSEQIDVVVIHDAARPLCSAELIQRVLEIASTGIGAIAALPASDTIHEVDGTRIVRTHDRAVLWRAQTPQAFPRPLIVAAHRRAAREGLQATDDAALVVHYGGTVEVVPGETRNLKVTVPDDLVLAESLLLARSRE